MIIERYQIGADTVIKSDVDPETVALILQSLARSDEANRSQATLKQTYRLAVATNDDDQPAVTGDDLKPTNSSDNEKAPGTARLHHLVRRFVIGDNQ